MSVGLQKHRQHGAHTHSADPARPPARAGGASFVDGEDTLASELIEIDENLCRAELTSAQRTSAIKRRREIWAAMHPDGKQPSQVGTPVAKHGREQAVEFATDTAGATGESRSSVYRHLARADALGDDVDAVVNSPPPVDKPTVGRARRDCFTCDAGKGRR